MGDNEKRIKFSGLWESYDTYDRRDDCNKEWSWNDFILIPLIIPAVKYRKFWKKK